MTVKVCEKCQKQATCTNSRQRDGYVIRRYTCRTPGCGSRWTTAEVKIEDWPDTDRGAGKIRRWKESLTKEAMREAVDRVTQALKRTLE